MIIGTNDSPSSPSALKVTTDFHVLSLSYVLDSSDGTGGLLGGVAKILIPE